MKRIMKDGNFATYKLGFFAESSRRKILSSGDRETILRIENASLIEASKVVIDMNCREEF